MTIARGLAITGDVQKLCFYWNFLENDLHNGHPNVTEIETFIDMSIDRINIVLKTVGYTLPIVLADSPFGYYFVKYWNAVCAAEKAARQAGGTEIADAFKDKCEATETSILEGTILLTDVPGCPSLGSLAESETSNVDAESGEVDEPFFTREDQF